MNTQQEYYFSQSQGWKMKKQSQILSAHTCTISAHFNTMWIGTHVKVSSLILNNIHYSLNRHTPPFTITHSFTPEIVVAVSSFSVSTRRLEPHL